MIAFVAAIIFTLGVSALCSVLEAMILSTTVLEVEELKARKPTSGALLERFRSNLEATISSILTVNTVANTLGAITVGGIGAKLFDDVWLGMISGLMTISILFFSEILPKNIGVIYRRKISSFMVFPLRFICWLAHPLTVTSTWLIRRLLKIEVEKVSNSEIALLAERGAREGSLGDAELKLIQSSLSMRETRIHEIMTPRNVVVCCDQEESTGDVLARLRTIAFARMPVYEGTFDNITGIVRRRDILSAVASGKRSTPLSEIKSPAVFLSEVGLLQPAMEKLIQEHQQLGVVIDEFGGFVGVVTLEDIFEFIIGREFYEQDDVAIDMQELARRRSLGRAKSR